jgi:hypothetical protein
MTARRASMTRSLRSPSQVRGLVAASRWLWRAARLRRAGRTGQVFRSALDTRTDPVWLKFHLPAHPGRPNDGVRNPTRLPTASTTRMVRYAFRAEQAA